MRRGLAAALWMACGAVAAAAQDFTLREGHGGPIMGVAVLDADGRIATASFDNSVGLWSGTTPSWRDGHRAAVNVVAGLPDGGLVSGGDDFRVLRWPAGGGAPSELILHKGKVMGLAVAPDGGVASASWDGTVGLAEPDGTLRYLRGHDGTVSAVAFSADGRRLYSGAADGTLRVWDRETGAETGQLVRGGFGINEIALPPDDSWLAYGTVDGVVRIIAPGDGRELADLTLDRRPVLALAHDPVQGQLAIGDGDGYIMVVSTADWSILRDFRATTHGPIWALAFSPDGTVVHAGGLDEALHSWPVARLGAQDPMQDAGKSFLRDPAEMTNGERQFARKCSICHVLTPGTARRAGPTLYGLFGRRAGTVPDYSYSPALESSDIVWTAETVAALFDEGPDHYVPGTKMPMQRITRASDRADLVDYLRRVTRPAKEQQ